MDKMTKAAKKKVEKMRRKEEATLEEKIGCNGSGRLKGLVMVSDGMVGMEGEDAVLEVVGWI